MPRRPIARTAESLSSRANAQPPPPAPPDPIVAAVDRLLVACSPSTRGLAPGWMTARDACIDEIRRLISVAEGGR